MCADMRLQMSDDLRAECSHVNVDTQPDGTVLCNLCGATLPVDDYVTGEELPASAREVLDHVLSELWIATDNGQAQTERDYATDVVERLARAYNVRATL